LAPFCYTGTCDTNLFNAWLEQLLVPQLKPGRVIILDNASFHKSKASLEIIRKAGCEVLFLQIKQKSTEIEPFGLPNKQRKLQGQI
jgi:hypothetical protein